ncbi:MAG: sigma-54-dependent Fis family transcriptional regulator [bacterium]|nr:sigma-54-dependent Fis family transcriptional regulator [bacterium]
MTGRILIVDDEQNIRRTMEMIHEGAGYEVKSVAGGEEALELFAQGDKGWHLVYLDIMMPGLDGMETLQRLLELKPEQSIVMISGHASVERAVEALKMGAADFLEKGFSKARLLATTESVLERTTLRRENAALRAMVADRGEILGNSLAIQAVRGQIDKVAPTTARVLITGESGTGKELVARAIHDGSLRSGGPFIRLNCAAVPEELIESELFGVVKGAFTGADRTRDGRFQAADGGTLFLDEIGDMSLRTQTKVLRVLQENEFEKVGSQETLKVDVRVIAATNKHLDEETASGRFREDLYYRLAVVPIQLPPLRARKEDIAQLAHTFASRYCEQNTLPIKSFSSAAMERLGRYRWPGNIRELKNQVERLLIMSAGSEIEVEDLSPELLGAIEPVRNKHDWTSLMTSLAEMVDGRPLSETRRAFETALIRLTLERHEGNVTRAARDLGVERTNLHKKIRQLGLGSD